jgi:hypothetical protein
MSKPSLLADLAWRLASSPEDVATDALTLILGRAESARHALNNLLREWSGAVDIAIARWKTQVVGPDESRTDMEGEDTAGTVRVIFENKFWAGLTDNQPTTYLHRLPPNGVLVFVAPATRFSSLLVELAERASAAAFGQLEFRGTGASRSAIIDGEKTLVLTSWDTILTTLAAALEAAQDHTALADLRQLEGLAERMDTEGFVPLTATDITGPIPRRVLQFCRIVDEVYSSLARKPFVDTKGLRISSGAGWYGPYLRIHGYGCQLIFSAERWARFGISPIWFQVSAGDRKSFDRLHGLIANTLPDSAWLQTEDQGRSVRLWMPIRLPEGREKDVVVAAVAGQVERVAAVLAPPQVAPLTESSAVSGV